MIKISPSILSSDLSRIAEEIKALENAKADAIHIDVMDGVFAANISFGMPIIKSIRPCTNLPLDVHLMIINPEKHIESFIRAGADIITIHPDSTSDSNYTITKIKEFGIRAGIALKPSDKLNILDDKILDKIDLLLVMTVYPGFSGQEFLHNQLKKIIKSREIINNKDIILSVDGGINNKTATLCRDAGADMLVSGSYIFSGDYNQKINSLRQ